MAESNLVSLSGIVRAEHQVASGKTQNSPYEKGTLEMQLPWFKELGLDLSPFYLGTLNLSIAPHTFKLIQPSYTFPNIKWHPNYPAENFSFSPCLVICQQTQYEGLVYYPHPETKIGHFQDDSIWEIIVPIVPNVDYGDCLTLKINPQEIELITPSKTNANE